MRIISILSFLAMLPAVSNAEEDLIAGADIGYGEYLSGECVTCHHSAGLNEGIPSITGLDIEGFVYIMHAYRNKKMENPVMQLVAGRLDNEQIASLAVYFGSLNSGE